MNEHAIEPAEQRDGPSLFTGIRYVTDEITKCAMALQGHKIASNVRTMNEGMAGTSPAGVKVALENIVSDCDDIAKIADQMKRQAARTATLIAHHMARQARMPK